MPSSAVHFSCIESAPSALARGLTPHAVTGRVTAFHIFTRRAHIKDERFTVKGVNFNVLYSLTLWSVSQRNENVTNPAADDARAARARADTGSLCVVLLCCPVLWIMREIKIRDHYPIWYRPPRALRSV